MRGLFKNKPLIIMLVAVLLLGVLAFITSADRSVSWVESTLGSVFQPVQTFAAKASNSIIGFFQRIFKTSDADKELEQLQVRMAQLEQAADENATLKAENERLKKADGRRIFERRREKEEKAENFKKDEKSFEKGVAFF